MATDLYKETETGSELINIMSFLTWNDGTESPEFKQGTKKQLCISLDFSTYTDVEQFKDFNDELDARLAKFRQLNSFPLFAVHNSVLTDNQGFSRYKRGYAINFGEDAEGAARLVSEILTKVNGWSPTEPYDMFTNVGEDVWRARDAWDVAHGFAESSDPESTDSGDNSGCLGMIIAFVVSISITLYSLFS